MKCDFCGRTVKPENLWIGEIKKKIIFTNPDGTTYKSKITPAQFFFCCKAHRDEYIYGV